MSSPCYSVAAEKELQSYHESCNGDAMEVERMTRIANSFKNGEITDEVLEACPELATMFKQYEKLKYRKIILERVQAISAFSWQPTVDEILGVNQSLNHITTPSAALKPNCFGFYGSKETGAYLPEAHEFDKQMLCVTIHLPLFRGLV
ncbi:hypothetical protein Y032_0009g450 [Ancylostoma ceylanicum]|uniref:Uncharacterized protein n=1 Tax=Ancylostoma ceylanicum TaxID=53326 RepID=A0A016VI42_9BILA|nr:hypothetical protein Y032_0009g450 [Ancylostoma ceylanicum]